jgi:polysaccharide biosynthesis/export protein
MIYVVTRHRTARVLGLLSALSLLAQGQTPQTGTAFPQGSRAAQVPGATVPPAQPAMSIRPDYILGPNDQIMVRVPQEEQLNERPFRVDAEGYINLPIAGRVRADGITVQALEGEIEKRLREYIIQPTVSITVVQFRSEPIFIVGAFNSTGIYPLQGRRTLLEMLAVVGGIQPNASRRIKVTRRADSGPLPLPNAVYDPEKRTSTAEISLQSLTQDINPAEDIVLQAYDIISVERAERVYVSGEVGRVAAIELQERESISIAQALTEAGGFAPTANRDRVVVLRPILGTNRRAVFEIDVKRVFEGKDIDFPLLPNDVLHVTRSGTRSVLIPVVTSIATAAPVTLLWLFIR